MDDDANAFYFLSDHVKIIRVEDKHENPVVTRDAACLRAHYAPVRASARMRGLDALKKRNKVVR